jgi:hypothetical protein
MMTLAIGSRPLTSDFRPLAAALVLCLLALLAGASSANAQMPDPKQMSGIPRPVDDLPNGSVSVRVIRGDMSHNLQNQPVEMRAGNTTRTVKTDDQGRAQFDNIDAGTPVKFSTVVDGERLESQEFAVQPRGGARLLLVATDPDAAREQAAQAGVPAVRGSVVIGGESRIIVEPGDATVSVFYVLDIVNSASSPVNPDRPFVFTLPAAAVGTTVIQGSSPLASSKGRDVTVAGPFPPGTTAIQVAAEYPVAGGVVQLVQPFPAVMQQVIVIAKKAGSLALVSPQFERNEESVIEGTAVVLGIGKELPAGQPFTMTITGLPYHSIAPRNIALGLAAFIIVLGAVAAARSAGPSGDRSAERKELITRREKLFQDLVRLEQDHRRGRINDARHSARREELLAALENVYGALDDDGTGPEPATRAGVAA